MLDKSIFDGVVVCKAADAMANHIIHEFEIPRLDQLAPKLKVNSCFNDHQSLRLWADRLCESYPITHDFTIYDLEDLIQTARTRFLKLFS
ncbi:hypothetical protein HCY45_01470 [Acinetobacter radioresistens]|uniref:hypothetical protein n=1 Tax=Acinetobacter radioresistens TaxID=40216 RepID=UPI002003F90B|nr:hypothetical protein [Acinetobacter radioresistens]MCK4097858.1 hypothetical protein [Acinetobacter radioresistens]